MKKYVFSFIVVAAIALYYFMEVAPYTECDISHIYLRDSDKSELTIKFKDDLKFDSFSLGSVSMVTSLVKGTTEVNASWEEPLQETKSKELKYSKGVARVTIVASLNPVDFPKTESGGIVYIPITFYRGDRKIQTSILRCNNADIKTKNK